MKSNGMKILKIVVPVVSVVATLASNWLGKKEQEDEIAKRVAEEIAKLTKGDA